MNYDYFYKGHERVMWNELRPTYIGQFLQMGTLFATRATNDITSMFLFNASRLQKSLTEVFKLL